MDGWEKWDGLLIPSRHCRGSERVHPVKNHESSPCKPGKSWRVQSRFIPSFMPSAGIAFDLED